MRSVARGGEKYEAATARHRRRRLIKLPTDNPSAVMESEAAEELSECARYGEEEEIKQVRARHRRRWLAAPAVACSAPPRCHGAAWLCAAAPRLTPRLLPCRSCSLPQTISRVITHKAPLG